MFIVFEGIDGSGTTSLSKRVCDRLESEGEDVRWTKEPTGLEVGEIIRDRISGDPDRRLLALLFAADRLEHCREIIRPALESGKTVVSDRYLPSSLVYQSGAGLVDLEWVDRLNRYAEDPDFVFYVKAGVDTCLERISGRSEKDSFEERSKLKDLSQRYDEVLSRMETEVHPIDNENRSIEDSAEEILRIIDEKTS